MEILVRYYKAYLPLIVYQLLPVGAMVGTLFTLTTLNKNNELVALFSMGMSLARVSAPLLALVGVSCILSFWIGDRIAPTFERKKSYIYYVEVKKRPSLYSTVKTDKIWYRSQNTIFNIQTLSAEKGVAQGITLYYFDELWNLVQLIRAKSVTFQDKIWNLEEGSVTLFTEDSSFPLTKGFSKKTLTVGDDLIDIQKSLPTGDVLSLRELKQFIQKNKEAGLDTLRYEVDYHSKISFSFAGLILSLMGIPFTVQRSRSGGNMLSVAVCIGSAFAYWIFFSSSLSMGKNGLLPPILAAWMPNLLIGFGSLFYLIRLKR